VDVEGGLVSSNKALNRKRGNLAPNTDLMKEGKRLENREVSECRHLGGKAVCGL